LWEIEVGGQESSIQPTMIGELTHGGSLPLARSGNFPSQCQGALSKTEIDFLVVLPRQIYLTFSFLSGGNDVCYLELKGRPYHVVELRDTIFPGELLDFNVLIHTSWDPEWKYSKWKKIRKHIEKRSRTNYIISALVRLRRGASGVTRIGHRSLALLACCAEVARFRQPRLTWHSGLRSFPAARSR
jgi:hypothetical protein